MKLASFFDRAISETLCSPTEDHCMSNVFEIRDPDTGAVIERLERK